MELGNDNNNDSMLNILYKHLKKKYNKLPLQICARYVELPNIADRWTKN